MVLGKPKKYHYKPRSIVSKHKRNSMKNFTTRQLTWRKVKKHHRYRPSIKSDRAPGLDNLETDVVKEAGKSLAEELAKLYYKCLDRRTKPKALKELDFILIHMRGDQRPICLLPHVYKTLLE